MNHTHQSKRRHGGFVIIAVLVIVMSALLIATSMLYLMQADATIAAHGRDANTERALLWSGVQVVSDELERQRETFLRGSLPDLDEQYVLYERNGRAGVVRLMPVGADGARAVPESAKLDVNIATREMLASFDLISEQLAQRIIAHRDQTLGRPLQSVAELLEVDGITPEVLYGPMDEIDYLSDARGEDGGVGERIRTRLLGAEPRGLADLLTVWSIEPALQRSGKLRINLNVEWSDELEERVTERFDENAANLLKQIFETNTFDNESVLYNVLKFFNVDADEWPEIIDTFTSEEGEHHFARVNINHAPAEVLAALPGIDQDAADEIVQARDRMSEEDRETIAWCAMAEVLDVDAYIELAGLLTTRSWTYRLRLAVGEVDVNEPDAPLEHMSIAEVVIDLASPRARLAYLRDVTMFDVASALASGGGDASSDERDLGLGNPDVSGAIPETEAVDESAMNPLPDPEQPLDDAPSMDDPMDVADETSNASPDTLAPSGSSKGGTRIGRWIPGQ